MTNTEGKTKHKRPSKGERTHQRRLKEAARKPGGTLALQMAKTEAAVKVSKKEKVSASATQKPTPASKSVEKE